MLILTKVEMEKLTRKPANLDEIKDVLISEARYAEMAAGLETLFFETDLGELDEEIKASEAISGIREKVYLAVCQANGDTFLVDTQGYSYARYVGRLHLGDL